MALVSKQNGLLLAVLLVAGAVFFYYQLGDEPILDDQINFVCISTGKTFTIDRDDVGTLPLKNPETSQPTLLPFVTRDGQRYVDDHYRTLVQNLGEVNRYVDSESLAVKSAP